ncbi:MULTISPECIES: PLDc N-terminal domain-containing protein [Microbispora]|nr:MULTISPECIES: PLDc N-terminal domain-containing protein [Microbispora]
MPSVIIGLALLAFWLYCLFDVITTPGTEVRAVPKALWILIVVLLLPFGALIWLLLGRPQHAREAVHGPAGMAAGVRRRPQHDVPRGPDDDPEFLRQLDRRLRDDD